MNKFQRTQAILALALVASAAVFGSAFIYFQQPGRTSAGQGIRIEMSRLMSRVFPAPSVQKEELRKIATILAHIDAKGDVAMLEPATAHLDRLLLSMMDMNLIGPQRNCMLAAQALEQGMQSIFAGGRWTNRDRFDAAMKDCD